MLGRRGGRVFLALLAAGMVAPLAGADTIYYQVDKDGTMRITNAPDDRGYHAMMNAGGPGPARSSSAISGQYAEQIRRASRTYGIDPNLVKAVIATESNFNPQAVSPKGARGLMQLMPSTARRFGVENIHDPQENIQGGVQYLRHLLDLFGGDLVLALAAYNAGEGIVQSLGRVPQYRETRDYVDRVLARYGRPAKINARSPSSPVAAKTRPARRAQIYSAVSSDGTLVFSDSPIPKPEKD
jgi:soluble lytic murein transglycosylase-like protein